MASINHWSLIHLALAGWAIYRLVSIRLGTGVFDTLLIGAIAFLLVVPILILRWKHSHGSKISKADFILCPLAAIVAILCVESRIPFKLGTEGSLRKEYVYNRFVTKRIIDRQLARLLVDTTVEPVTEHKEIRGWKLVKLGKPSLFRCLGLTEGDVIESINGLPPSELDGATRLLLEFRSHRAIRLMIRRDTQKFEMTYMPSANPMDILFDKAWHYFHKPRLDGLDEKHIF